MNHDLMASHSVDINASSAAVWLVLTSPSLIAEYLHGTETITEWQVGSAIIFQGEYDGHLYKDKGVIQEFKENEVLAYTYWSGFSGLEDSPENYSLVTYTLEHLNENQTRYTWHQKGFVDETRRHHSQDGLPAMLDQIKVLAEKQEMPRGD